MHTKIERKHLVILLSFSLSHLFAFSKLHVVRTNCGWRRWTLPTRNRKNDFWSSSSSNNVLLFFFLSNFFFCCCCCSSCYIIFLQWAANQESIFLLIQLQLLRFWQCVYSNCEIILYINWLFSQVGWFIS